MMVYGNDDYDRKPLIGINTPRSSLYDHTIEKPEENEGTLTIQHRILIQVLETKKTSRLRLVIALFIIVGMVGKLNFSSQPY